MEPSGVARTVGKGTPFLSLGLPSADHGVLSFFLEYRLVVLTQRRRAPFVPWAARQAVVAYRSLRSPHSGTRHPWCSSRTENRRAKPSYGRRVLTSKLITPALPEEQVRSRPRDGGGPTAVTITTRRDKRRTTRASCSRLSNRHPRIITEADASPRNGLGDVSVPTHNPSLRARQCDTHRRSAPTDRDVESELLHERRKRRGLEFLDHERLQPTTRR